MAKVVLPKAMSFEMSSRFDYNESTEKNFCDTNAGFVGKYGHIRSLLDYSYHCKYSEERQYFHDRLIERFLKTTVHDRSGVICDTPLENWIVFTAGPMGSGKGHTIQWLNSKDLFPFDAFVNVDPDAIRDLLPETAVYRKVNEDTAGYLTQKEVGYISECLSYDALEKGKNVLVDGSLRDAHWYLEYFKDLRKRFTKLRIGIIEITAKPETIFQRAKKRAKITGRVVPEATIMESIQKIPESIKILGAESNFVGIFDNEDNLLEPRIKECTMSEHQNTHIVNSENEEVHSTNISNKWSLQLQVLNYENSEEEDQSKMKYLLTDHVKGTQEIIDSWKELFAEVWTMTCPMPAFTDASIVSDQGSISMDGNADLDSDKTQSSSMSISIDANKESDNVEGNLAKRQRVELV